MSHTWAEAVKAWRIENAHRTEKWKKDEAKLIAWLSPRLGDDLPLTHIRREAVERLRAELLDYGYKHKTVNHYLAALRAILRGAMEREWITTFPRIRLLPIRLRVRWLNHDQALELLQELPPHLAAMAELTLETGLRKANLTGLTWSQIDLARREIVIPGDQMKNRAPLVVPLSPRAIEILRARLRAEGLVFPWRGKKMIEPGGRAWREALKRIGAGDFHWHDLRHTWASWHAQAGTPDRVLQELGGWKTQLMVQRYAHLNVEHLRRWVEKRPSLTPAKRKGDRDPTRAIQQGSALRAGVRRSTGRASDLRAGRKVFNGRLVYREKEAART